ncbi:MAG: hypothetical protein WCO52_04405 [bacterium]
MEKKWFDFLPEPYRQLWENSGMLAESIVTAAFEAMYASGVPRPVIVGPIEVMVD